MSKATTGMLGEGGEMLKKPIEQKVLTNIEDYNILWETEVSKAVETLFQGEQHFMSAFSFNPKKVVSMIASNMRVVPIDLMETLKAFHKHFIVSAPIPPDGANMG